MAAYILEETRIPADIVPGARGEFSVWLDGQRVAGKSAQGFPQPDQVVARLKAALA